MILFRKAHFQNFRILRDLTLEFSTDPKRPLTVIRGENESGKTTILTAMQWAFWGDSILPDEGRDYRLHPIDWDPSEGRCTISVEITLETEADDEGAAGQPRRYSVQRQCVEEVDGTSFRRHSHMLTLYELSDASKGTEPKLHPELLLAAMFPKELREVFFTDGARVLSFTGADLSPATKRKRVQDAIRALLGIDLLDDAREHVRWVQSDVNAQLKHAASGNDPLGRTAESIELAEKELGAEETRKFEAVEEISTLEQLYRDTRAGLDAALEKGNRDELKHQLRGVDDELLRHKEQISSCKRIRSELFRDEALPAGLLFAQAEAALGRLSELREKHLIPHNFLPILEQRLALGECICGTPLSEHTEARAHVLALVKEQEAADEISSRLSDLVPAARRFASADQTGHAWKGKLEDVWKLQLQTEASLQDAQLRHRAIDQRIKEVPDTDVVQLRAHASQLLSQKDLAIERRIKADTAIARLNKELETLKRERDTKLKLADKYRKQLAQLDATKDVVTVLDQAYRAIQETKIAQVSEQMNGYFMRMIGSSEERGIIKEATISDDFDIVVYGPERRELDPDHDLNGASRRALTMAFILALTTVSGVTAPSVIDTPISELSGAVRKEVLSITAGLSRQLVVFLTRADIHGVEDVIEAYAGRVLTITNSTHYDEYLVNDPGKEKAMALECACSHAEYCPLCERHLDSTNPRLRMRLEGVGARA